MYTHLEIILFNVYHLLIILLNAYFTFITELIGLDYPICTVGDVTLLFSLMITDNSLSKMFQLKEF